MAWIISGELREYHDYWRPGSFSRQVLGSHGIIVYFDVAKLQYKYIFLFFPDLSQTIQRVNVKPVISVAVLNHYDG